MPIWLSGGTATAAAVDIKYPPSPVGEELTRDLGYWLNYYRRVYASEADVRRAAEAAREKAEEDRKAAEASRSRTDWATTPGRLSAESLSPEAAGALADRLREESSWIDGRVEVGLDDPAGQVIEVAFPAEVRPELIRGTVALALGPLVGDLDRLWAGIERHWARVKAKGGDVTERRIQIFVPRADHDLDQRYRMFVPRGQAREIAEARAALDRAVEQVKSERDRENLEKLREMIRGAKALGDVEAAQQAAREAAEREAAERDRERAAEERARVAEEAAAQAIARATAETERARREAETAEKRRLAEVAELERRLAEAQRGRTEAERRADREARERELLEETMAKMREAFGLPAPGAPRESVPVVRRRGEKRATGPAPAPKSGKSEGKPKKRKKGKRLQ